MSLKSLAIAHFRCLREVSVEAHPQLNVIAGPNGSGKTSFLEALYFLGRGRSFRSTRTRGLVQDGEQRFVVRADLDGSPKRIGIEGGGPALRVRVDGHNANGLDELIKALPVQVIEPGIHRLVDAGPSQRRAFLDWGVFHVKHTFLEEWRRYQRAVKQRNAVLRQGGDRNAAAVWEDALVASGEAVHQLRATYLTDLLPHVESVTTRLLDQAVAVDYHHGWGDDESLREALDRSWERDSRIGQTHVGPQRADLRLRFATRVARDRVSRGQQKLLASSLVLAQLRYLVAEDQTSPILLLDDPAAELDTCSLERLFSVTRDLGAQQFITGLDVSILPGTDDAHVFHVEQGSLQKVV
jgi:DNA replication and repair protein RecF